MVWWGVCSGDGDDVDGVVLWYGTGMGLERISNVGQQK